MLVFCNWVCFLWPFVLHAACRELGCLLICWLRNHLLSKSYPVCSPAAAILNTCRKCLLAGWTQIPAGITSWLSKPLLSLLAVLQPHWSSASGVVSQGKDGRLQQRLEGWSSWESAPSPENTGVCMGHEGVCSWSRVMSGWMEITAPSYLHPGWYLPSVS